MSTHLKVKSLFLTGYVLVPALLFGCAKNAPSSGSSASPDSTPPLCPSAMAAREALSGFKVPSHIPAAVARFTEHGKFSEDQQLTVTIALTLNNQNDLQQQLRDLYDPTSPSYHHFLAPGEFRSRYAPTADQIANVTSYLESRGLHDFSLNPSGYMLQAQGSVGVLNSAFMTELHQYQDTDGSQYFAPLTEPVLPSSLPIRAVHGLDNVARPKPFLRKMHGTPQNSNPSNPNVGGPLPNLTCNGQTVTGLTPSKITTAYNVPTTVNAQLPGHGQTLGLVEFDGFTASDISAYETCFGIAAVTVTCVNEGNPGCAPQSSDGSQEVTLDIELMIAIAPGASSVRVYSGTDILTVTQAIATEDLAKEVSSSWGVPEDEANTAFVESESTIFAQMATQGQSMYAAAGDNGAYGGYRDGQNNIQVADPASQPNVTAVGGTSLTTAAGAYFSETSWNDGITSAGGGGYSIYWSVASGSGQPGASWQNGVVSASTLGCSTMRNVPDVSLESDPNKGYAFYWEGSWGLVGGTSCAAPLWAGYTALVNQQRVATNVHGTGAPLGFPNPALYSIGSGGSYNSNFHDIADGSTNLFFPAVTGFDDSTGWGSFKGTTLFNTLSAF